MEYAPAGYLWMRVSTPQVFEEYLIPIKEILTVEEQRNYERLQDLAELHRTSIMCAQYRAGQ